MARLSTSRLDCGHALLGDKEWKFEREAHCPPEGAFQVNLTNCLPKFLPLSKPRKASGADSMPCATDSRGRSLPVATSVPSSLSASGQTSRCSPTMKPSSLMRFMSSNCGYDIG